MAVRLLFETDYLNYLCELPKLFEIIIIMIECNITNEKIKNKYSFFKEQLCLGLVLQHVGWILAWMLLCIYIQSV